MDFVIFYTLGAIILYHATGVILDKIEQARGERFAQRNMIYFVIIFVLAMLLMNIINPAPQSPPSLPETGEPAR